MAVKGGSRRCECAYGGVSIACRCPVEGNDFAVGNWVEKWKNEALDQINDDEGETAFFNT